MNGRENKKNTQISEYKIKIIKIKQRVCMIYGILYIIEKEEERIKRNTLQYIFPAFVK